MKANEAPKKMYIPEKIYLPYKDGKVIGLVKETGVPYKSGVDGNIEYTRTDAFIEKACSWLSNMPLEDMEYKYDDFDTSEGWYKMIEDFKKYMKGE